MDEKQHVIHSSIRYVNDIGHPSHAQTSNIRNKQRHSKPLSVTCTIKCFKNINVGNRWQGQVKKKRMGKWIWSWRQKWHLGDPHDASHWELISFARAYFTLDISPFKRFWSCIKVSKVCLLEVEVGPGTRSKGVWGPCSEPGCYL